MSKVVKVIAGVVVVAVLLLVFFFKVMFADGSSGGAKSFLTSSLVSSGILERKEELTSILPIDYLGSYFIMTEGWETRSINKIVGTIFDCIITEDSNMLSDCNLVYSIDLGDHDIKTKLLGGDNIKEAYYDFNTESETILKLRDALGVKINKNETMKLEAQFSIRSDADASIVSEAYKMHKDGNIRPLEEGKTRFVIMTATLIKVSTEKFSKIALDSLKDAQGPPESLLKYKGSVYRKEGFSSAENFLVVLKTDLS